MHDGNIPVPVYMVGMGWGVGITTTYIYMFQATYSCLFYAVLIRILSVRAIVHLVLII